MKLLVYGLLMLSLPVLLTAYDRITGRSFATRSEVLAKNGMAATSQPLATGAALQILRDGGNAIDAAIAANAVLGLVEPTGSGIGGDLFAIVWDADTKRLYGLNASGRSPHSLTLEHFQKEGLTSIPSHGPLPVTVPGTVDGGPHRFRACGPTSTTRHRPDRVGRRQSGTRLQRPARSDRVARATRRRRQPDGHRSRSRLQ